MIYGEVGDSTPECHKIPCHQASISNDTFDSCRVMLGLVHQMLASTAYCNSDGNQIRHPLPSLPQMHSSIPKKGHEEAESAHDTDAYTHTNVGLLIHGSDSLPAHD